MTLQTGSEMIDQMIGGNEIDRMEYHMDDCNTSHFCEYCDILHNEI